MPLRLAAFTVSPYVLLLGTNLTYFAFLPFTLSFFSVIGPRHFRAQRAFRCTARDSGRRVRRALEIGCLYRLP